MDIHLSNMNSLINLIISFSHLLLRNFDTLVDMFLPSGFINCVTIYIYLRTSDGNRKQMRNENKKTMSKTFL